MVNENLSQVIESWINEIGQYDPEAICTRPSATSWSLGQVCMHLLHETTYFVKQAAICAMNNEHQASEMSPDGKWMFRHNGFPDEKIEGPATNSHVPQPGSKEQLIELFSVLINDIQETELLISKSPYRGKTKHPGLNYFSAAEWLQFARMHFQHHLRQKRRIDDFLEAKKKSFL
jgi:hypothetical protein